MKLKIGAKFVIFVSILTMSLWGKAYAASQPVIVILSATYCRPCHILADNLKAFDSLESLSLSVDGTRVTLPIVILEQDIPTDQAKIQSLGISLNQSVPQLFIFSDHSLVFHSETIPTPTVDGLKSQVAQGLKRFLAEQSTKTQDLSEILREKNHWASRVTFIGTGNGPEKNPIFVGYTIKTISDILENFFGFSPNSIVTLYGSGKVILNDAIERSFFGHTNLVRLNFVHPDSTFTPENLAKVYADNEKGKVKKALFIYSGHGSSDGVETWGAENRFGPDQISKLNQLSPHVNNVIISGVCHGGILARAASCGFFGASPTTDASGCWESKDSNVKDYASDFFKVIANSKNSRMPFEEAHWRAVLEGESADTPYTTIDALADDYFKKYPEKLPDSIGLDYIVGLTQYSSNGEKAVLKKLSEPLKPNQKIYFKEVLVQVGYKGVVWGVARVKLNGDSYKSPIQFTAIDKTQADKIFSDDFASNYKRQNETPPKYDNVEFFVERNGFGSQQDIHEEFELIPDHQKSGRGEPVEIKETPESKPLLIQLARRILFENEMHWTQDAGLKQQFDYVHQCEQQNLKDFLF
jgi:hypothetical protein